VRRPPGDSPREICVVMLSAIGDAVHVLPVVNALKRHWPRARITWVLQPLPARLVEGHPAVDRLLLFHRRKGVGAWRSFAELARRLRGHRFDLALGLQVYFKAGLITALVPARTRLGFDRRRARDLQWLFTDERIPDGGDRHVQDQYFEFLEHLGVDPEPVEWRLTETITEAEREAQRSFFRDLGAPACAVVVGTSKPEKDWPPERYAHLLDRLEKEHGFRSVLVGGPSRRERRAANRILETTEAQVVDALGDDLRRLLWILDGAGLTVSPDTGPLHVSRAVETPVIGLYGHTNPRRTGPYRRYRDLVVDGYRRRPEERYPISREYRDGMERITVEAVLERVERAVERYFA